jgi:hypothetical protein
MQNGAKLIMFDVLFPEVTYSVLQEGVGWTYVVIIVCLWVELYIAIYARFLKNDAKILFLTRVRDKEL